MAAGIDPKLHKKLLKFVEHRIACIRAGDRTGLRKTYDPSCLRSQNDVNRRDYKWYLKLIEDGFGEDTLRIDIAPVDALPTLPFAGLLTYGWPPDFGAFVQTVSGRRTLWLIAMFDDEPKVVLPAFGGKTGDQVATGEWRLPRMSESVGGAVTTLKFRREQFTEDVGSRVAGSLFNWAQRLKFETLRAVAVYCAPWHGECWTCLLTTQELYDVDKWGKWNIGGWRWNMMEDVGADLLHLIRAYYEGNTDKDLKRSSEQRAKVIFECLAEALQSEIVARALKQYTLADDFEVAVFNPDDSSEGNYCNRKRPSSKPMKK